MAHRDFTSPNAKDVELTRLLRRATEDPDTDLRHTIAYAVRAVLDELPLTADDIAAQLHMTRASFDRQVLNLESLSLERADAIARLAGRHARTAAHRTRAEFLNVLVDVSLIGQVARTAVLQHALHGYGSSILAHVLEEVRSCAGEKPSVLRQRGLAEIERLIAAWRRPETLT
jgi:hypothetical protein